MSQPLRVVTIVGSLRGQSYSRVVADAIIGQLPAGSMVDTVDIGVMPHYNEDLEQPTAPAAVLAGRQLVAAADMVVIVTPEFNHGLPGVLKNALDWLSRPAFACCLKDKPVLFASHSPGALGGVRAQYQLRETLAATLSVLVPVLDIAVTFVGTKVTDGRLSDDATLKHIGGVVTTFLAQAGLAGR